MDLELREALAFGEDRARALTQLLPGSEDHDYHRCVQAQHAGRLDEADQVLEAWPQRHGETTGYHRLQARQLLYRAGQDPAAVADELRNRFGADHSHEAEVEDTDPTRPTRLAARLFDAAKLLAQAVKDSSDLSQVTDEGLYELIGSALDATRRRVLLGRLAHTPEPGLVPMIAADLEARQSGGFGSLTIHDQLTLPQLHALAELRPELRTSVRWVGAVVTRMRPHRSQVDLELDLAGRQAHLEALWMFLAELPPALGSLQAHVLWHLLDTTRRRGLPVDETRLHAYLQLPRSASFLSRAWLDSLKDVPRVELMADFRSLTGLPPAGDDEGLVRALLHDHPGVATRVAPFLDRAWLDAELATIELLTGGPGADRATLELGPARAAALRDRIELAWCVHNPTRFDTDAPVVLEADVKHVPALVVKVFRIDPLAYFQRHQREVGPDLDLDGLAASHEQVLQLPEPPVRRVRRRIELPMCARAGTYVIDLIGNGTSSRAVIHKGRLRHALRLGAAGHVVTMFDEAGQPRPDARAWIGDREYVPDAQGAIVVPFSTRPGPTPALLFSGDLATVQTLTLQREAYDLGLTLLLDRQALTAGRTVRAIARLRLDVGGAPASLALLQRPTWELTLTDRRGVTSTRTQPLELTDDAAAVLEWPLGDDTASVALTVRAVAYVRSEQRDQELTVSRSLDVATMHGSTAIEALYLTRAAEGFVVSALGKTGEPRARRPVTITLVHRWTRLEQVHELATDEHGRVELGLLPGVASIGATLGDSDRTWTITDELGPRGLQVVAGEDVTVPIAPSYAVADVRRRLSLVETNGAPVRHPDLTPPGEVTFVELADALVIRGLVPGSYALRAPGLPAVTITVLDAVATHRRAALTRGEVAELSSCPPAILAITVAEALDITLQEAGPATRVHVLATRFAPALLEKPAIGARPVGGRIDRARGAVYVSGRELGDEYRYVLERRAQRRYPGVMLDRPSLLLDPWARRTTATAVATARGGGRFAPAPAPAMSAYGMGSAGPGGAADDDAAVATYDFLASAPAVIANLVPDEHGAVRVPLEALGDAAAVTIVIDDPAGMMVRQVTLPERPLAPRDLRLQVALAPDRHAMQAKRIQPLRTGEAFVVEDLATAQIHLIDTVERAHAYLLALRDDPTLREYAFVTRWHALPEAERRALYSKHACHELRLFLYLKDRPFFDAVIAPHLVHKRTKTFLDHWLLGADLTPYLVPPARDRLNAVERALLAQRLAGDALARCLADEVAVRPVDPERDTRLIDALLGAATLDGDPEISAAHGAAFEALADEADDMPSLGGSMPAAPAGGARMMARDESPRAEKAKKSASRSRAMEREEMHDDLARVEQQAAPPLYRAADTTQEWAEHNWWHRTPAESGAAMIEPNRLWRDLAAHTGGGFLSPGLGLAAGSFAEMMCALAVTDLPFVAGTHAITPSGARLEIVAASPALVGSSQIVDGELVTGGAPLVVGVSYVRADDRYTYVEGEQVDRYVEGAFATGVVYTALVVLTNPTSSRQRIAALVQIPRGSIPVAGTRPTQTIEVLLAPYQTHGHEASFYLPTPGTWPQFPVHVSRGGVIVEAAPPRVLEVTAGGELADPTSWPHVSQRGSLDEVVRLLATANLAALDLTRVAWRLRDRGAYDRILGALAARQVFVPELWAYAILHHDAPRLRAWLRGSARVHAAGGPVLEMIGLDAEDLGAYEHLEYAPLVNARAHRLGPARRILNDGLAAQYQRFLDLVVHRPVPTAEDLLAATAYLLAQDRLADALATLARVTPGALADRMQHDYLAAYAACVTGDVARARALATPWREHPVDRWRHRFAALLAMLAEVEGAGTAAALDPRSRDQQHAELAARQPTFEITLDRDGILIHSQHVAALELRFFEMDVELLFSRQPFVQSDVARFSYIEPGHREHLSALAPEHRLPWPAALRGKNVVVEGVGVGQRKAKVHYANDLVLHLANQVGQLRVQRASDQAALPATYVKVYARMAGGATAFYKDGYTDLRGWFDYATLSTTDLDQVERFGILVNSDEAGAAILEAAPPQR